MNSKNPKMNKHQHDQIILLEGDSNYTFIHLADGNKKLSSYTLLRHQKNLIGFVRVNRKYLINPDFIKEYKLDSSVPHVLLKSGDKITIPRRKVKAFSRN